jgi:hypothetical protein
MILKIKKIKKKLIFLKTLLIHKNKQNFNKFIFQTKSTHFLVSLKIDV